MSHVRDVSETYTTSLPIGTKMKKLIIFLFIFLGSISSFAIEENSTDQLYNEMLEKHIESGQINQTESLNQTHQYTKDKKWQKQFNQQVRGVASKLKKSQDRIELVNPAIEISVK